MTTKEVFQKVAREEWLCLAWKNERLVSVFSINEDSHSVDLQFKGETLTECFHIPFERFERQGNNLFLSSAKIWGGGELTNIYLSFLDQSAMNLDHEI